jgi:hypothetical protein
MIALPRSSRRPAFEKPLHRRPRPNKPPTATATTLRAGQTVPVDQTPLADPVVSGRLAVRWVADPADQAISDPEALAAPMVQ